MRNWMRGLASVLGTISATGVLACASLQGHASTHPEYWGFAAPWDPRSAESVTRHGDQLDAVVSGWVVLDSTSFKPELLFPDSFASNNAANRRYMALVTSYHGTRFHPETIRGLASDSTFLAQTAGSIASLVSRSGYRGMVLDFEGMSVNDLDTLKRTVTAIADSARAHGIGPIGIAIPATDTAAYPARALVASVDFVVVMLYDQHWLTSQPGPIASPDWARRWLAARIGEIGPGKIVAAYPTYGYEWRTDSATAVVSYLDAQRIASLSSTVLERDVNSATLHGQSAPWTIWVSDAVLVDALVRDARVIGITKFAFWRLGLEDPALWRRIAQ